MRRPGFGALLIAGMALLLGACASKPPAPVVERSTLPRAELPVDGLHRVSRGDTLHGIAFKYGLDYRDIAAWNGIRAPYTIYPDQVVRLQPPPAGSVRTASVPARSATTRPAPADQHCRRTPPATAGPVSQQTPARAEPAPKPVASQAATASAGAWQWPVQGRVLRSFKAGDPTRNGIDIVGQEGQPVRASAAGEVVYSGNGLIGYGELIIIKHDERMLSAYAHNRRRLVAEGERISQGQQLAELGRNDRNEQVLHFEIRRDGKPVNPLDYLPKP